MKVWGVDGCPGGWFAVSNHGDIVLEAEFAALLAVADRGRLYVDMPIGLPDSERQLERLVRKRLSVRPGSIFSVPCRQAVYSASYKSACDINAEITGKKLSKQSWYLCDKIRQIDILLRRRASLRRRVMESHPELAYAILNDGPLQASKKSRAGVTERLEVLSQRMPDVSRLFAEAEQRFPRKVLALDDIVDALVLMVVATGVKKRLVAPGECRDSYGIPIRMIVPA